MAKQYILTNKHGKFYFKDPEMTILHRTDGPAIEWVGGNKEWLVNGIFIFAIDEEGNIVERMR